MVQARKGKARQGVRIDGCGHGHLVFLNIYLVE
jgi:hypothetical protein